MRLPQEHDTAALIYSYSRRFADLLV